MDSRLKSSERNPSFRKLQEFLRDLKAATISIFRCTQVRCKNKEELHAQPALRNEIA
jgi:hypothetical protein